MGIKIIAKNKRASYDYELKEKFEAGICLQGTEVKSLRNGKVTIGQSYVAIDKNEEAWIYNMHIAHYEFGNIHNHPEDRKRKLLLNKSEIEKISHQTKAQSLTIIPTIIYFKRSTVKVEIALGKGKKLFDKRQDEKTKEINQKLKRGILE